MRGVSDRRMLLLDLWMRRTPIRTTALNASGCHSHLWRNELVWRRNVVAEAGFCFLQAAWKRGSSIHAYNKCSDGLGCLNRGRQAFHQWRSIPYLELGRSSPEISGDGSVHPRVDLPRFGDR